MRKAKMKVLIAVVMITTLIVALCSGCNQQSKKEATPEDVSKSYEAFIQEQKETDNKDKIYAAITKADDGSQVLLIADEIMEFNNQAVKASVYSYSDGQVTKICDIESTSTAYPIGFVDGKYLVTGSHHSVERYLVSGNSVSVEKLDGIAMEEESTYKMTSYTMTNDKISDEKEEEISQAEGDDFANAIYEAWEPIEFTEY